MATRNTPTRGDSDALTRWAFYFFMGGIALTFLFALVYLATI